jgi:acetyltransferase-like isoleucine patch superfamily enzyme
MGHILSTLYHFFVQSFFYHKKIEKGRNFKKSKNNFFIENGSKIIVGSDCIITNCVITLKEKSILEIGDHANLNNSTIQLINGRLKIFPNVIFNYHYSERKNKICIENSEIVLRNNVKLTGVSIYSRFHSYLDIGEYTGVSPESEIFCHEKIIIGNNVLIAEDVCIYDTNTHSLESDKRVEELKKSFPLGLWDSIKPETKPVYIGNNSWIGKGASILKGAVIEEECVVGLRTNVGAITLKKGSKAVGIKPRILNPE